ncbi:hypothetical protein ACIA8G_25500 [Lentzea sp. NPDC051213]|uniref:hypothetical protein n=1 Tax=Lentzea sp. NPDC051213 TaxID=3364126 RepID=UPI003793DD7F
MTKKHGFETWWYWLLATAGALTIVVPSGYFLWRDLAPNPLVGECVKQVNHSAADLTFEEVPCSERKRSKKGTGREFEVGAIESTCPPGDYTAVPRDDEKACYLPTFAGGACYVSKQFGNTTQPVFVLGKCKEPGARKAESIIHDVYDKSKCANKDLSLAFSKPARTICMVKP